MVSIVLNKKETSVFCQRSNKSSPNEVMCGIPQGSILGPLLFLLYINDMTDNLEKTTLYLYADDTEISSSSDNFTL